MSRLLVPLVVSVTFSLVNQASAQTPLPERGAVLGTLSSEHPRLLAKQADFERIHAACQRDARLGRWLKHLRQEADQLLDAAPVVYEIPDGKRLLAVSRKAKQRILLLALMGRLSGDPKYADRCWEELQVVTQFKDWNPPHFLDTAEMTFAVAIGYDWLYDAWSRQQRDQLRQAIIQKGLEPGLAVYRTGGGWTRAIHNWNQVCNGGLAVGALAIGDVEPELAREVLHAAVHSLPLAMHEFAPDGGWGEGPGYWRYATEYNVYVLAAMITALGTDFGLSDMPGFSQAGDFPLHFVGPTGKSFNFADASDGWGGAPQLFWLADRFRQPSYALAQLAIADERPTALDLLWGSRCIADFDARHDVPTARYFQGVSVVALRGSWTDPRTTFVAFKGGDNRVNHGHLDLGTFVVEGLGQRWAIDLGPDNYNLPGYFGRQRWTYFRNNTLSHNTLVIDGQSQSPTARAPVLAFAARDEWAGGVVDLTAAWPQAKRVWRGIALIDGRRVLIQDEVEAEQPVRVTWQMLTDADVSIDGKRAILTKNGERIVVRVVAPDDAAWSVSEVTLSPPERPVRNTRKLAVALPGPLNDLRCAVLFDMAADSAADPELIPLNQWPRSAD